MFKQFADDAAGKLTNTVFRGKMGGKDAVKSEPGLWGVIRGEVGDKLGRSKPKKKVPLSVPISRSAKGDAYGSRFELKPKRSSSLMNLATAAAGKSLTGKGEKLKSATIHIENATEHIAKADIHTGGAAPGTSAGGAGSSPSGEQFLGALGEVGSFASAAKTIRGLF